MEKRIIGRGALVGALAGLLAFIFARLLAEPVIGRAIDYESSRDDMRKALDKAAGLPLPADGPDIFSRSVQSTIGIGFGMIVFGIAMGALFAVVYCVCVGRVGRITPRNLALLVAGGMFLALYAVPFLKYPANPPSIGHPESISERTGLYLLMVLISVVALVGAIWLGRKLQARLGNWFAVIVSALAFIVVMAVVIGLLPSLGQLSVNHAYGNYATETPQPMKDAAGHLVFPGFPADDLYLFRLYSVLAQLLMWTVIGVGFASLAPRLFGENPEVAQAESTTAAPIV